MKFLTLATLTALLSTASFINAAPFPDADLEVREPADWKRADWKREAQSGGIRPARPFKERREADAEPADWKREAEAEPEPIFRPRPSKEKREAQSGGIRPARPFKEKREAEAEAFIPTHDWKIKRDAEAEAKRPYW